MIERQNILDLIGGDSNKYQSCIIVSFSFDFLFFEQRVLPKLRQAGIVNINVFVDARMYEQQLEEISGFEYQIKKSYSIIPVKVPGAFHPKILLAIGRNNGFLALGSGNFTNSGLSNNDEIWGALHTYKSENKDIELFKNIYDYLRTNIFPFAFGVNKVKIDWVDKNASWLQDVLNKDNFHFIERNVKNQELMLLDSFADKSIYQELLRNLPKEPPHHVTIISPFYNRDGKVISNLLHDLSPKKMDVILDPLFGTVPYTFEEDIRVKFYAWNDLMSKGGHANRLHAKIMQFQYANESYILIGSPNATVEAFGEIGKKSRNAELAFFLKKSKPSDWIKELKINIVDNHIYNLKSYLPNTSTNIDPKIYTSFPFHLKYVELDLKTVNIEFVKKQISSDIDHIVIVIKNEKLLIINQFEITEHQIYFTIPNSDNPDNFIKIYLASSSDQRISNFESFSRTEILNYTNPDKKRAKFQELISQDSISDNDLIELLDYADFKNTKVYSSSNQTNIPVELRPEKKEHKNFSKLDPKEFNALESELSNHFHHRHSYISHLEDFLDKITFRGENQNNDDPSPTGDQVALSHGDEGSSEVIAEPIVRYSYADGLRLKNKITQKLSDLHYSINIKYESNFKSNEEKTPNKQLSTIQDLKNILVGSQLILMKIGKVYQEERSKTIIKYKKIEDLHALEDSLNLNLQTIDEQIDYGYKTICFSFDSNAFSKLKSEIEKNDDLFISYIDETPSIVIDHKFFHFNPNVKEDILIKTTIKGFLFNTYSKYLYLMFNGIEHYQGRDKEYFEAYKSRLLFKAILLLINTYWSFKETNQLKLILLNSLFLLLPEDLSLIDLNNTLNEMEEKMNYRYKDFEKNKLFVINEIETFMSWKEKYLNNRSELISELTFNKLGKFVFKSNYGFGSLLSIYENSINVSSPLGIYSMDTKNYEFSNILSGKKGLFY